MENVMKRVVMSMCAVAAAFLVGCGMGHEESAVDISIGMKTAE
jgi:hypothetical protein